MNLDWLLKSSGYAVHASRCGACAAGQESNCGGVSRVDLATAVAVLTTAVDHLRGEVVREISASHSRVSEQWGTKAT